MKLSSRYNRTNLFVTVAVLLISSVFYYFMIEHLLRHQLDDDLKAEEQEITDFVRINNRLPNPSKVKDQQIVFFADNNKTAKRNFASYTVYDRDKNENDSRRRLIFPVAVGGKWFYASVSKSQIETEFLLKVIFKTTLEVILLLLVTLFLINRFLFNRLWHPFNNTLTALKKFSFSDTNGLQLEQTDTDEFKELNSSLTFMTHRIRNDYMALKTFTENASHEMQTPLAVIYSKLDLLIQDERFDEQQTKHLQDVYYSVNKLRRLNKSLLLLTKIENNQYNEKVEVSIDKLITEKLQMFEELVAQENIRVETDLKPKSITCNKETTDILISNLIKNAIIYNVENGFISVKLENTLLEIANYSGIAALDENMVFQRFYRHPQTKQDGNGLGLSIVKQVCEMEEFGLKYNYRDGLHVFSVQLS